MKKIIIIVLLVPFCLKANAPIRATVAATMQRRSPIPRRLEGMQRRLGGVQQRVRKFYNKQKRGMRAGVPAVTVDHVTIDQLAQRLDSRARKPRFSEYYPFYFTVPRELIIKKQILTQLGKQLRRKGHDDISDLYQKPLLNYLAQVTQDKPIQAEFNPKKLINNKTNNLLRQRVFGPLRRIDNKDFADISFYKPKSLDDLMRSANALISDNAGGQMLIQMFVPKNMADAVAQARWQNTAYAIDQIMQQDEALDQRLMNAKAFLRLNPDGDYNKIKLFVADLMPRQQSRKIDREVNKTVRQVVKELVNTMKHPPEVPERTDLIAPPLPPRDEQTETPPVIDRSTKPEYSTRITKTQWQEQVRRPLPPLPQMPSSSQQDEQEVAPPVPPRDDLFEEVAPPLPPRDEEQVRRPLPSLPQKGEQEQEVLPPVPPRDDLLEEVAPPLPPRDEEQEVAPPVPPRDDLEEVSQIAEDSSDEFAEDEMEQRESLKDVLAEGLAGKFARIREAEEEEELDDDDDFWQEEAGRWKEQEAEKQKRRQEEAVNRQAAPSDSYVDPMEQMIKGFEERYPQDN